MPLPSWTKPSTWSAAVWAYLLLSVGVVTAFGQVVGFDFVNFDDNVYVTTNMDVQSGGGVMGAALLLLLIVRGWIPFLCVALGVWVYTDDFAAFETFFTARKSAHWHPLTWLSLAMDYEIYNSPRGLHAWGFHLTNLLLHLANTLLLFAVLKRSTRRLGTSQVWPCFVVAALFGWHPLHVESVAWISERKDVLSTFFWMLTMLAYLDYVEMDVTDKPGRRKKYVRMTSFFVLGLLSKPMIVTLPCVLLLWDVWPLGRVSFTSTTGWKRVLVEKAPMLVLALISGVWTTVVMRQGITNNLGEVFTVGSRLANALLAMFFYLRKMVWPSGLAPSYSVFADGPPAGDVILAGAVFLACSVIALGLIRRAPYVLIGWLWFVGTVLPVSLRLQAGAFTWADRYTYVPLIGVFIAVVWGINDLASGGRKPPDQPTKGRFLIYLISSFAATILLACLAVTWEQVKIWADSESLWTRTLQIDPTHFIAHVNLALDLERQGRMKEALALLQEAVRLHPKIARGHLELGAAYEKAGELEKALACYRRAVELDPENLRYRGPLVSVLRKLGRNREADEEQPQ